MSSPFCRVKELLDLERELIIAGKLSELAQMESSKSAALKNWVDASPCKEQITRISATLNRNHRLLTAAADGVSLAIDRYREIRVLSENFVRYMSDGKRDFTPICGSQRLNQSR